ncbi:MAG: alpha/beta hydrolase [Gemmobacter sp.]|nr:alpha/beta hydrolase [Gemmobacter sp.]
MPALARPLVFLHGWSMSGAVFDDALRRLSRDFRCYAPDFPGHGAVPGRPLTIDGCAQVLEDLLVSQDLAGAVLIGWSMGATVAWHHAARFGTARTAGIVSLDMSPRTVNDDDWQLGLRGQTAASAAAQTAWFRTHWPKAAEMVAAGMFGAQGTSPLMSAAQVEAQILTRDPEAMADMWASLTSADLRADIARLQVPMLVIHGAQSKLYSRDTALWLTRTAPHAQRVEFLRAGHSPHLESPEDFADVLVEFSRAL